MNPWELNEREINAPPSNRELYISYDEKDMVAKRAQKKLVKWLDEACLYPDDKLSDYEYNGTPLEFDLCIGDWKYLKRELGIE